MKLLRLYGAYTIRFRRYDGEWVNKRLATSTHSEELAESIAAAIDALPISERTKERTDALAQQLFNEAHYK